MTKNDYIYYDGDPKEYNQKFEQWRKENPGADVKEVSHENINPQEGKMQATIKYETPG
jgi:hypothetical protein